jgi:ADP-ribosylglycohydrolase
MSNLTNKIRGCLLGVMIGDAMGMPAEMLTPEEIAKFNNGKGIIGFQASTKRSSHDGFELEAGSTTDDWQLTQILLDSLIEKKSFDLTDIAFKHILAAKESVAGWGGTTRNSVAEIELYFKSFGKEGRSPFDAPAHLPNRGLGNGIAMKVAPLALYSYLNINKKAFNLIEDVYNSDLINVVTMVGKMTHSDPRAWSAAYTLAELMIINLCFTPLSSKEYQSWVLDRLIRKCAHFEKMHDVPYLDSFGERLVGLKNKIALINGSLKDLREFCGTGCISTESVLFAIALALRNCNNFCAGILEAVASGGDADTISAMVGAVLGLQVGYEGIASKGIPYDWANQNNFIISAVQYSEGLINAFSQRVVQ